ncbi:MAG: hypothetical protein CL398_00655 [Acidiferrobacteraceae bacterium]|nr:hypothetical protein [Acidiferrobacteraceae bacterium]
MPEDKLLSFAQKLFPVLLLVIPVSWIAMGYWFLDNTKVEVSQVYIVVWLITGLIPWLMVWYIARIIDNFQSSLYGAILKYSILVRLLAIIALVVVPGVIFLLAVLLFIWKRSLIS